MKKSCWTGRGHDRIFGHWSESPNFFFWECQPLTMTYRLSYLNLYLLSLFHIAVSLHPSCFARPSAPAVLEETSRFQDNTVPVKSWECCDCNISGIFRWYEWNWQWGCYHIFLVNAPVFTMPAIPPPPPIHTSVLPNFLSSAILPLYSQSILPHLLLGKLSRESFTNCKNLGILSSCNHHLGIFLQIFKVML